MSAEARTRTPGWGAVAGEQLRMLLLLQRRDLFIVAGIGTALVGLGVWQLLQLPAVGPVAVPPSLDALGPLIVPLIPLGALWPLGVWRHDSPSERAYFWSLPVPRPGHTLLRVGLGWVLLMGVCLAAMAVSATMATLFAARLPGAEVSLAYAYLPLAAPTLAYLLVSVPVVLLDSPVRTIIWTLVALLGLRLVAAATGMDGLEDVLREIWRSLGVALSGAVMTGESPGYWLAHYLGWFSLAAVGLLAGAFRHRDAG